MDAETAAQLGELAEEPALWLPPQPGRVVDDAGGCVVVTHGRTAWVHRIRLEPGGAGGAVGRVRALLRGRGIGEAVWWVGEHTTPAGLADELAALGLEPGEPPELASLGIDRAPGGEASAEVRRADDYATFLRALEIDWEAFGVDEPERRIRRREAAAAWPALVADGSSSTYLALLEGRAAGFARAAFTPRAALLLGGATLPWARGRGVYTSTVHARFAEAASRGVPRAATAAGKASGAVLERLGFTRLGRVLLLRDRL